ncbi:MAG: GIY-YIG nuclease family protein [bacterium]
MPKTTGIYKLIQDDEIVYIGQSLNCERRIGTHLKSDDKDFNSFEIIPCKEQELDELEREYINKYEPEYNKQGKAPKNRKLEGVYLDKKQRDIIAKLQEQTGKNKSEIVRKALRFLDENVTIK